jgi:hypothetical protein
MIKNIYEFAITIIQGKQNIDLVDALNVKHTKSWKQNGGKVINQPPFAKNNKQTIQLI